MGTVYRRAAARRDLIAHFVYLAENAGDAGDAVAERFMTKAEASFNDLANRLLIGSPLKLRHAALTGIRKWRVKDFDNYLIFYQPQPDGVSIVRVLHASQDWWSLFGFED